MSTKNEEKTGRSFKENKVETKGPLAEKDEVKLAENRLRENMEEIHDKRGRQKKEK